MGSIQLPLEVTLNQRCTFENFIVGDNHILWQLIQSLLTEKSVWQYGSLYLWGQSKSGKSHFLNAIAHHLQTVRKNFKIINCVIDSPSLLRHDYPMDFVLLDQVDAWLESVYEEKLFHLWNQWLDSKAVIVLTSRLALPQLKFSLPDLQSRFAQSLTFELLPLSTSRLELWTSNYFKGKGLGISSEVIAYLLNRYDRSVDSLLIKIDTLDKAALQHQCHITIPFIKKVLEQGGS